MKHLLFIFLLLILPCMAQTPLAVSAARTSQRAGTQLVDINYDLKGGQPPYTVAVQGSADGGATWTLPMSSLSGHVGNVSAAGSNRKITWNAGADWPGQLSERARFRVTVTDAATLDGFALIPAGNFQMGDNFAEGWSEERPVHTVNVSAFYMGKYEVTKALWDSVRTYGAANGYNDLPTGGGKGANHPVHSISWYAMVKWCNARSQRDGLTPCYTVSGAIYKTGSNNAVACNWNASGYRLPTEAEWEKAARGGLNGKRFPWGDTISHSRENYYASSSLSYDSSGSVNNYHPTYRTGSTPYSSPVGSFAPNGYGLYDMAGNMWEWVWDWYGSGYYASSPSANPRGPSSGSGRVIRGGDWGHYANRCRVANRLNGSPGYAFSNIGFRMARSSVP